MKWIIFFSLLSSSTLLAQECDEFLSKEENLSCLGKEEFSLSLKLEFTLQEIYKLQNKLAIEELRLKELKTRLGLEQAQWEAFSPARCSRQAMAFYEGTEEALEEGRCLVKALEDRLKEIQNLLKENLE